MLSLIASRLLKPGMFSFRSSHASFQICRFYEAGQPTPRTHPQILTANDISPGIAASEYHKRRSTLCELLGSDALAVIPASSTQFVSGVVPYPYRQDPDFFYLTGIHQHAVAVLNTTGTAPGGRFTLFIDPPSPEKDRWDGAKLDKTSAAEFFGADEVYFTQEMPRRLANMAADAETIYYDMDRTAGYMHSTIHNSLLSSPTPRKISRSKTSGGSGSSSGLSISRMDSSLLTMGVTPLRRVLHLLRALKSPAEIGLMRQSAAIAASGLGRCMRATRPGVTEYQLAAEFEHECRMAGAQRMAFPQVVAAGADACTIHYSRNDKVLRQGQLVLMDAGCEFNGYVSDVSRTWPVDGRYTPAQAEVYEMVLEVHRKCVAACKPGSSVRELHGLSVKLICQGIHSLGLCGQASIEDIYINHYRKFYWHSLSHYIGLDVHDTALLSHDRLLKPGFAITIEPGLYIPDEEQYGAYRGIGIRIEDDILLTETGCEIMSDGVPTAISAVEDLMAATSSR